MKKIFLGCILLFSLSGVRAQSETYGKALNLGLGFGYGNYYYGRGLPLMVNYEFDVAKNITIAPFIGFYTYQHSYYWYNPGHNYYGYYNYRYTAIPIGAKGTYYFDELLGAGDKWDFYGALSLGFIFTTMTWDNGYTGDPYYWNRPSPLYIALHIGAEYHFTEKVGMFVDLSSASSTLGVSFHF